MRLFPAPTFHLDRPGSKVTLGSAEEAGGRCATDKLNVNEKSQQQKRVTWYSQAVTERGWNDIKIVKAN